MSQYHLFTDVCVAHSPHVHAKPSYFRYTVKRKKGKFTLEQATKAQGE